MALAAEAIRIFGRKGVNAGDSKPRVFQGQYNHSSSGGESLVATRPKLCTLRAGLAREPKDQERSQQEEKEKEESIRKGQEARNEEASGRTPGSETVTSQRWEDPNSSLEAPNIVELEAASARHGIWGKLQLRFGRASEVEESGYMGAAASSSSSTTTGQQRGSKAVREDSPPVKSPPVLPKYVQGVPGPLPKSPPVLPKYVQHVNETIEGLKTGYYPRKSPPPGPMNDAGGKAAARGAAAM